mmetsp:Transcript_9305/g.13909  ORF Transcript_9305/g.13909 Transcript_9305/m.13909 type:complete len:280 (-) Transcript_9305:316-1155(-)|eukprot:CAMPEP_0194089902 /NCGR_PEP_ID=MMETSP0149-20130528/36645_1 /TAXON_ID=122233 /ORGANISM="Chaetoceros debilis, Strain MM31A-1" /LENGTH=279 /DNA_ID=CAMNT_0038773989 /DNA_START=86 /DNA_END=925 /DNA_ORIENTATION=+
MAKKGGGGGGASKKSEQKRKTKVIDDKTFGLKNKNKSKKVQALISSVTKNVMHSGDPKERRIAEQRVRMKADAKARKKAAEQERNALFGEALMAVKKKTTTKTKAEGGSKGRDHDDGKGKAKSGQSRAMKMMFQMDAQEMEEALKSDPNYVPTLEDEVELRRQRKLAEFKAKGIKGTPVTHESFKAWQEKKRKRKQEEAKKKVEAELKKKKGGKGLSVLSGRDLFEYKRDLFKDDEDAQHNNDLILEESAIEKVAEKVESDLFLGEDDDLEDLDDLDDD